MNSQYSDGFLQLKGHSLGYFDIGRVVPAWTALLSSQPPRAGYQERALLCRLVALISNCRNRDDLVICLASSSLFVSAPLIWGIFGHRLAQSEVFTIRFSEKLDQNLFVSELIKSCPFLCFDNEEVTTNASLASNKSKDSPRIFIVEATQPDLCRKIIDYATGHGNSTILIKDYCKDNNLNHYGYARDLGMRVLENADGSGELFVR